jgi:hypothetical protein
MQFMQVGYGVYNNVNQQIDPQHHAARVSVRPADPGVFGQYSIALASGVMAAGLAAGAPIFAFRWATNAIIALIKRVRFTAGTDGTAFAQGSVIIDLIRATGFTVQDTGGATISLAGKSQVIAQRMGASQIQIAASATGQIAVANTATLTAGTRTLDNNAMGILVSSVGAVPANYVTPLPGLLLDRSHIGDNPLELVQSEGFVIRATVPATGTWKFGVEVDWDEVDPARYF